MESTTETKLVPIAALVRDDRYQIRTGFDDPTVDKYRETFRAAGHDPTTFHPIHVFEVGGKLYIGDGRHRDEAAASENMEEILATVHYGATEDDLVRFVCKSNLPGLPRCPETNRRAVRLYLDSFGSDGTVKSLRAIATACAVSTTTAKKYRDEWVRERSPSEPVKTTGNDGRVTSRKPTVNPVQSIREAGSDDDRKDILPADEAGVREAYEAEDAAPFGDLDSWTAAREAVEERRRTDPVVTGGFPIERAAVAEREAFPIEALVSGELRERVQADIAFYFAIDEFRKAIAKLVRQAERSGHKGRYFAATRSFLKKLHPRDWIVCRECKGEGCSNCWSHGVEIHNA